MPRRLRSIPERLTAGIDTTAGPDACHPWTGYRDRRGYGQLKHKTPAGTWTTTAAHRAAYEAANGELPVDVYVLHACHRPECCNLRHLRAGDHLDNMRDRATTGAGYPAGEDNPNAHVPDDLVAAIRAAYQRGTPGAGTPALAARFGVSRSHVQRIVTGAAR